MYTGRIRFRSRPLTAQLGLGFDDSHGASVVCRFCASHFSSFFPGLEGHYGVQGLTIVMAWLDFKRTVQMAGANAVLVDDGGNKKR